MHKRILQQHNLPPTPLREFLSELATSLILLNKQPPGCPSIQNVTPFKKVCLNVPRDLRRDNKEHWPTWNAKRNRCKACPGGIFWESGVYTKLKRLTGNEDFVMYGNPAYPLHPLLIKPYGGSHLLPAQQAFNCGMSVVGEAVEWRFDKVLAECAFLDLKKKFLWQPVATMCKVANILSNCHTTIYGSQVSSYFCLQPPKLQKNLKPMSP
ncbi:hypothetical protein HPB51_025733 [Rhipicephalus microplus]|uniref:DDE Tnp4 domain-containing protein n=1 Tax=Rhipicephalus microplus TaxID=6941 RepID=A0A9J6F9A6_RHIMP|nr:hypothetical protein HPB51_025733 [Rhipicephalus microplus]